MLVHNVRTQECMHFWSFWITSWKTQLELKNNKWKFMLVKNISYDASLIFKENNFNYDEKRGSWRNADKRLLTSFPRNVNAISRRRFYLAGNGIVDWNSFITQTVHSAQNNPFRFTDYTPCPAGAYRAHMYMFLFRWLFQPPLSSFNLLPSLQWLL